MEIIYEQGTRDASELDEFARELLREVRDGGGAREEAREAGIDVEALLSEPEAAQEIAIKPGESGFEPVSTVIIVTIAAPIVRDLWRRLLLSRIERKWGATAVGPEVKPPEAPPGE